MSGLLLSSSVCTASAQEPRRGARPTPVPTPTPTTRRPVASLSASRLSGTFVGTLDDESFVLTVRARTGSDPVVDCTYNAGLKEPFSFGAIVSPRRGLQGRQVPGLDVSFGAVSEDEAGTLWIQLLDDRGRVRGELSETKPSKDRR